MNGRRAAHRLLAAAVGGHLLISLLHGWAHAGAAVALSLGDTVFVWVVIMAGPLVGLALSRSRPIAGGWTVAAAMTGSLIFGLVKHFVVESADHVAHVAVEWRLLFTATAVFLILSETVGAAAGVWYATRRMELSS